MNEFGLQVALGNVQSYKKINKFGETPNADSGVATDLWDGSVSTVIWVPPNAARVHQIDSTDAADAAAGTGMRTLRLWGLKTWGSKETFEDVILDGTSNVATANAYVIIHRMKGLTWGSGGVNAGLVCATADTDSTVTACIVATQNQSQMMIYGVPSTQRLEVTRFGAQLVKNTGATQRADGEILWMEDAETNAAANTAWTNKENFLVIEAASPWSHPYDPTKSFEGPGIIKFQVSSNAADVKVIGFMDAYLVDKSVAGTAE